jgi:hypothetical protein
MRDVVTMPEEELAAYVESLQDSIDWPTRLLILSSLKECIASCKEQGSLHPFHWAAFSITGLWLDHSAPQVLSDLKRHTERSI